jgi:hypothetical protein
MKTKYFKVLGAIKLKGIIRIAKVGSGHLCMREKNLCFDNNDIKSVGYNHVLVLKQDLRRLNSKAKENKYLCFH